MANRQERAYVIGIWHLLLELVVYHSGMDRYSTLLSAQYYLEYIPKSNYGTKQYFTWEHVSSSSANICGVKKCGLFVDYTLLG